MTERASELQRRAITGSFWTVVHTLVSLPVSFVANALVARALGVTAYGKLAVFTAALLLAFQFSNLGVAPAVVQWGSADEARGRTREVDDLLRRALGFHALVELPFLVVVAFLLTRGQPLWVVLVLLPGVVLPCLLGAAALSISIENRTAQNARLAILVNLATQITVVAVAYATSSPVAVWASRTLVTAVGLMPLLLLLDRRRRRVVLRVKLPSGFGQAFWRYALLMWAAGLVSMLVLSRSEVFLLEAFHRHRAVGYFALAYGLSQQITAPADAMLHAMLPAVSGMLAMWPERAAAAFARATRVSMLACGGIVAIVIPALALAVPLVYGAEYAAARWLFVPLATVSCLQSVNNPVTAFVSGRRRGARMLASSLAALAVDAALAVALIPPFGAWGAVAANVGGQAMVIGTLAVGEPILRSQGVLATLASYRPFFTSLLIAAAGLAAGAYGERWSRWGALAAVAVLSTAAYLIVVRFSRQRLTVDDRDAMVRAAPAGAQPYLIRLLQPLTQRDA